MEDRERQEEGERLRREVRRAIEEAERLLTERQRADEEKAQLEREVEAFREEAVRQSRLKCASELEREPPYAVPGGARRGAPDIEGWYQATISGSGGEPTGAINELIMKWLWPAADPFTGRGGAAPGKQDHVKGLWNLEGLLRQGPGL